MCASLTFASSNWEDSSLNAKLRSNFPLGWNTHTHALLPIHDIPVEMNNERRCNFSLPWIFSLVSPGYSVPAGEGAIYYQSLKCECS